MSEDFRKPLSLVITVEGPTSDESANKALREEKKPALRSISAPPLTRARVRRNFNVIGTDEKELLS